MRWASPATVNARSTSVVPIDSRPRSIVRRSDHASASTQDGAAADSAALTACRQRSRIDAGSGADGLTDSSDRSGTSSVAAMRGGGTGERPAARAAPPAGRGFCAGPRTESHPIARTREPISSGAGAPIVSIRTLPRGSCSPSPAVIVASTSSKMHRPPDPGGVSPGRPRCRSAPRSKPRTVASDDDATRPSTRTSTGSPDTDPGDPTRVRMMRSSADGSGAPGRSGTSDGRAQQSAAPTKRKLVSIIAREWGRSVG